MLWFFCNLWEHDQVLVYSNHLISCWSFVRQSGFRSTDMCKVPIFFFFLFKTIYIRNVTLHWRQGKGEQRKCLDFPNCSGHFESPHKTSRSLFLGEKHRWWWVAGVVPKLSISWPPAERVWRGGRRCCWGGLGGSGCCPPASAPCGS